MLKNGIILVATGHANYGNMAYNLALSIRAAEPDTEIAIVHAEDGLGHLSGKQREIFDHVIELPENYRKGFGVKLHLDQLTPFDNTLALDVDMLWLGKKPSDLFKELQGCGFTIITEGNDEKPNPKYYFWAEVKEIQKAYGVSRVWQSRSEVIYFEAGCNVFEQARKLIPEKELRSIRMFGTFIPDELYFNIAMAVLGINPHVERWMPAYWARLHNETMPNLSTLYRDFYLLSFGSNAASPIMKRAYDNVMRVVSNKLKIPYIFKLKSKKEWAPGRLKI